MRKLAGKILSKLWLTVALKKRMAKIEQSGEILSVFFHRPNPVEFEKWVVWCKNNGFTFISTRELEDILLKQTPVTPKLIWLTFDDGWRNNYTDILPVLTRHNVPATIFVSANLINEGVFWLELARLNQSILGVPVNELRLCSEADRKNILKKMENHPQFVKMPREFMTWDEVKKVSDNNLVSIGNHTHNHAICTKCTPDELEAEITQSQKALRQSSANFVNAFAYPNGNFNHATQHYLTPLFNLIALVDGKNINTETNVHAVTRICLGDKLSLEENIFNMFGFRSSLISVIKKKKPEYN